jgi:intracellular sulfur oxidation DsrE/DsrF family protein
MTIHDSWRMLARRSFFSKLGFGLVGGAAVGGSGSPAQAQSAEDVRFQPARHAQDDWLDQIPGKHRYVVDAPNPEGFGDALAFLTNYFNTNTSEYGLKDGDLAVVLIARHLSTAFGYNDAIWAKYGKPIADRNNFLDPKTKQPPTVNVYNSTAYGRDFPQLTNRGTTLDSLIKRGLHIGVCQVSSRGYAAGMAMATGMTQDAVFEEMKANLLPNARLVPAGIVAVNRAQERGYSLATVER